MQTKYNYLIVFLFTKQIQPGMFFMLKIPFLISTYNEDMDINYNTMIVPVRR